MLNPSRFHCRPQNKKMLSRIVLGVIGALSALGSAKEMAVDMQLKKELYDSGLKHEEIISLKNVCR